jgi:hypothetical protein
MGRLHFSLTLSERCLVLIHYLLCSYVILLFLLRWFLNKLVSILHRYITSLNFPVPLDSTLELYTQLHYIGKKGIKMHLPDWWLWEIEITPHLEKRMIQRNFTEIMLREMLSNVHTYEKDIEEHRYKINVTFKNRKWEIIVEPDLEEELLVIITAYILEE